MLIALGQYSAYSSTLKAPAQIILNYTKYSVEINKIMHSYRHEHKRQSNARNTSNKVNSSCNEKSEEKRGKVKPIRRK